MQTRRRATLLHLPRRGERHCMWQARSEAISGSTILSVAIAWPTPARARVTSIEPGAVREADVTGCGRKRPDRFRASYVGAVRLLLAQDVHEPADEALHDPERKRRLRPPF